MVPGEQKYAVAARMSGDEQGDPASAPARLRCLNRYTTVQLVWRLLFEAKV
jgi:hypothetical protein